MRLIEFVMHLLNSEGVERIDCDITETHHGLAWRATPKTPAVIKNGEVWVMTSTFELNDD